MNCQKFSFILISLLLTFGVTACSEDKNSEDKSKIENERSDLDALKNELSVQENSLSSKQAQLNKKAKELEETEARLKEETERLSREEHQLGREAEGHNLKLEKEKVRLGELREQLFFDLEEARELIAKKRREAVSEVHSSLNNFHESLLFELLDKNIVVNSYLYISDARLWGTLVSHEQQEAVDVILKENNVNVIFDKHKEGYLAPFSKMIVRGKILDIQEARDQFLALGLLVVAQPIRKFKITPIIELTDMRGRLMTLKAQPQLIRLMSEDLESSVETLETLDLTDLNKGLFESVLKSEPCGEFTFGCMSTLGELNVWDSTIKKSSLYVVSEGSDKISSKRVKLKGEHAILEILKNRLEISIAAVTHQMNEAKRYSNEPAQSPSYGWGVSVDAPKKHPNLNQTLSKVSLRFKLDFISDLPTAPGLVTLLELSQKNYSGRLGYGWVEGNELILFEGVKKEVTTPLEIKPEPANRLKQLKSLLKAPVFRND